MPQMLHTDFKTLLARLFNGNTASTRPATLYLGLRTDKPAAGDTLATVTSTEVSGGGYARVAIPNTAGASPTIPDAVANTNDWALNLPATAFAAFSGPPTTNGATHWFLTDQASGTSGKLFASGPLNAAAVTDTISGALTGGTSTSFTAATSGQAAKIGAGDYLWLGTSSLTTGGGNSSAAGTEELVKVASVSGSVITLTAAVVNNHASGEAWSRDGSTRTYAAGFTETVTASLLLASMPN